LRVEVCFIRSERIFIPHKNTSLKLKVFKVKRIRAFVSVTQLRKTLFCVVKVVSGAGISRADLWKVFRDNNKRINAAFLSPAASACSAASTSSYGTAAPPRFGS
jgi:hypothetical protein